MLHNNDIDIEKKPIIEKSTRVWQKRKARSIYSDQLLCLSALLFMAVWRSGWRAFALVLASVLASVVVDMICCYMSKKIYNPRDLSTITAGMCIALMMPVSINYPIIICGSALAMGVKHIFGGKDNYIFNPTAVALAFLIICYPSQMLLFPKLGETLPVFGNVNAVLSSGIESYLMKLGSAQQLSLLDMLLGNFQGPMGTTHILVVLVCAVCLMFRRSISTMLTLTTLSITIIIASLFPLYDNFVNTLALELIGGYLLFGLLFLANDPQTIPKTQLGKLYQGIFLGISIILFRYFGKVEGSFVFALLLSNAVSIRADVAVQKTLDSVYKLNDYLRTKMSFYERFSQAAKTGQTRSLSDTQEIIIDHINYDMPPLDNKVIKINRKKPNLLTRTREKIGTIREKGNETEVMFPQQEKQAIKKVPKTKKTMPMFFNSKPRKKENVSSLSSLFKKLITFMLNTKEQFKKRNLIKPIRHSSQANSSADINKIMNKNVMEENEKDGRGKEAFEEYLTKLRIAENNKNEKASDVIRDTPEIKIENGAERETEPEEENSDFEITDFDELSGMPGVLNEDIEIKEEKTPEPEKEFKPAGILKKLKNLIIKSK